MFRHGIVASYRGYRLNISGLSKDDGACGQLICVVADLVRYAFKWLVIWTIPRHGFNSVRSALIDRTIFHCYDCGHFTHEISRFLAWRFDLEPTWRSTNACYAYNQFSGQWIQRCQRPTHLDLAQLFAKVVCETPADQRTILLFTSGTNKLDTYSKADRVHINGVQFAIAFETYADKVHSGNSKCFCDASIVFRDLLPD